MRLGRLPKRDYITRDMIQRLGRKRENVIVPLGHIAWLSVRTQPASPLQDDKVEPNYLGRKNPHPIPNTKQETKGRHLQDSLGLQGSGQDLCPSLCYTTAH